MTPASKKFRAALEATEQLVVFSVFVILAWIFGQVLAYVFDHPAGYYALAVPIVAWLWWTNYKENLDRG
jgi:hypothetical protein